MKKEKKERKRKIIFHFGIANLRYEDLKKACSYQFRVIIQLGANKSHNPKLTAASFEPMIVTIALLMRQIN